MNQDHSWRSLPCLECLVSLVPSLITLPTRLGSSSGNVNGRPITGYRYCTGVSSPDTYSQLMRYESKLPLNYTFNTFTSRCTRDFVYLLYSTPGIELDLLAFLTTIG